MKNVLNSTFYLALSIKKTGRFSDSELAGRLSVTQPTLGRGEIAMKLNMSVPSALFSVPTLQASIAIPEDAAIKSIIDAEVIDNVQEILKQQTGLDVRLEVFNAEPKS